MGFEPYTEPSVPTEVTRLEFGIISEMIPELDENGIPTGQRIEQRSVRIRALISNQDFAVEWEERGDHNTIVNQSLLTSQQIQDAQAIMDSFRANAEAHLLPVV